MSMPANAARLRPVAVASALVLGLGLAGCANYDTLDPYQPAAGIQTDAPGVKVRNLMVLSEGDSMHLAGTLIADAEDTLEKVEGTALKPNTDPAGPLTIAQSGTIKLPELQRVNLADSNMKVTGDVKPGGMTEISLDFAKAGSLKLHVPVVDAKAQGFASSSPEADASATATPAASATATPAASGEASASATPSATPGS
ncbi:hypothetical protein ACTQ49_08190 [Luteococcus sp. Sow4_B9]|uniref:hypothetical protein n=1 Tax=Luteococcus sp. Sow4_B9 TaxID=3438792 RepID=UPI003F9A303C